MLRGFAAGLVVALGAAPAAAQNVSGWYAGIYAGLSNAGSVGFEVDQYMMDAFQTGTIETPSSFVNDGGLDPDFFDFLSEATLEFPYADFGYGTGLLLDGTLALLTSPTVGLVVGYGLGNGFRVEGDFSGASFSGGLLSTEMYMAQGADGSIDGAGVWTWANAGEIVAPPGPPVLLSDMLMDYTSDMQFLLLSAYYDIDTGTQFTPYLGGGVGLVRVTNTFVDDCLCIYATQTRLAPAAQLGAGVKVALTDLLALDLGYRYKTADGVGLSQTDSGIDFLGAYGSRVETSGIIGVHTLQAGLTFALP